MTKRGISTIIATIMMILFVLIATGVVWVVIQNILSEETEEISSGLDRITLSIVGSSVNLSDALNVSFIINRDIGKGDLVKIKIILYDEEGESYAEDVGASTLGELGSKKFSISKGGLTISKISIAPITESISGKETLKGIVNTYKIPS